MLYMTPVLVATATVCNPSSLYFASGLWSSLSVSPKLKWLILIRKAKCMDAAVHKWQKHPPRSILKKGVQKIYCKFTGKHSYQIVILIKSQSSLIEIALRDWCFPVNLLYIFRTLLPKNNSGGLLLKCFSKTLLLKISQYW